MQQVVSHAKTAYCEPAKDGDAKDLQLKLEGHFSVRWILDQQVHIGFWMFGEGGAEQGWGEGQNTKVTVDYVRASILQSVKTQYRVVYMCDMKLGTGC